MTTTAVLGRASAFGLVGNETLKGLQLAWRRRGLAVTLVVANGLSFLGFRLLVRVFTGERSDRLQKSKHQSHRQNHIDKDT